MIKLVRDKDNPFRWIDQITNTVFHGHVKKDLSPGDQVQVSMEGVTKNIAVMRKIVTNNGVDEVVPPVDKKAEDFGYTVLHSESVG